MKRLLLLLSLSICFSSNIFSQNVLVIDYNNGFSSDQSNNSSRVYNRLVATMTSVTRVGSIPATISTAYDQVWIFGFMGAASINPVVNYMNAGGAVYVQSEVGCCGDPAQFLDNLINATVTIGGSITHDVSTIHNENYQYQVNPNVFCGSGSFSGYGAAIRAFPGTPAQNAF